MLKQKKLKRKNKSSFSSFRTEKEKTTFKQSKIYFYLESLRPMFLITVPAVDWSVTIWFERNLGFLTAICTGYIMHFTRCAIIPTTTIGSISFFHLYILPFLYLRFLVSVEPREGNINMRYLTLWIKNWRKQEQKVFITPQC